MNITTQIGLGGAIALASGYKNMEWINNSSVDYYNQTTDFCRSYEQVVALETESLTEEVELETV